MNTRSITLPMHRVLLAALLLYSPILLNAQAQKSSSTEWRNEVGVTYVSGLSDLVDALENNYYGLDVTEWPVGLTYRGYLLYPQGFGFGVSAGPMVFITGDIDAFIVPVGVDARYVVGSGGKTSLILRAGARYPITSGDHMEGSSLGFVGGAAVEFPIASGKMAMGLEAAYDSSEVEVQAGWRNEDIKLNEISITLYFRF